MSLARTVARNSLLSGLDMLVDIILPPVASIIVARAMGPAKLGAFSYVMWISTTAMSLGGVGLASAARKYLADNAGQRQPNVFRAVVRASVIAQAIVLTLLALVGLLWANVALPEDERLFASLAMLAIVPGGIMFTATAVNNSVQELQPNVVGSISSALVHTVGMVLAVLMGWGLVGLAAASLASRICDCAVRWWLTMARMPGYLEAMGAEPADLEQRPKLAPGLRRELVVFTAESTILTLLTMVVWNRSEMLFLKHYWQPEEVAYFSVAFGLSLMPGQAVSPFSRAASVSVYAEQGRDARAGLHVTQVYWRYMVLLVMPASLGLAALAGPLLRVLYGVRYYPAAPVLTMAAALSMFAQLVNPPTSLVTAAGGQRRLVVVGVLAAIATLLLDYFLVRYYAALGGALANGLGQAVSAITVILIARRYSFSISAGYLLRVTGAALAMAALVAGVLYTMPDILGIVIGPVLGVLAYGVFLRIGKVVGAEDVERLLKAESLLPRPLRATFRKLLMMVATPGLD